VKKKVKEDLAVEEKKARALIEEQKKAKEEKRKLPKGEPGRTPKQIAEEAETSVDRNRLTAAEEQAKTTKTDLKDAVDGLQQALAGYQPVGEKGGAHADMAAYVDSLDALCDLKKREIKGETIALDMAA
jgi:hypothetical protein